jgi:hypothetical protein
MFAFFKGWRRKAGLILLLITVLMACHWMRTWVAIDRAGVSLFGRVHEFQAGQGGVIYRSHVGSPQVSWYSSRPVQDGDYPPAYQAQVLSQHAKVFLNHARPVVWVVLHQWLVLPLTMSSALLILWPRRNLE